MTALLASVASPDEIEAAVSGGADIIDLKDPARGALGAWELPRIREAVARLAGRRPVSATVGDLPMAPALVAGAAESVAAAGAGIVKVGMFEGDRTACIAALAPLARRARVVAVLFADRDPDAGLLPLLARVGFFGVMLDTADKSAGSLRAHADDAAIACFTAAARVCGLYAGLAGSLEVADIAPLLAAAPDFLGFRRALCAGRERNGVLDAGAVAAVRAALDAGKSLAQSAKARKATATAGAQIPAE